MRYFVGWCCVLGFCATLIGSFVSLLVNGLSLVTGVWVVGCLLCFLVVRAVESSS